MITKTEKLLNTKMSIKEANKLAEELYTEYKEIETEYKNKYFELDEKMDKDIKNVTLKEFLDASNKCKACREMTSMMVTYTCARRRSKKMRLDLESVIAQMINAGISLI